MRGCCENGVPFPFHIQHTQTHRTKCRFCLFVSLSPNMYSSSLSAKCLVLAEKLLSISICVCCMWAVHIYILHIHFHYNCCLPTTPNRLHCGFRYCLCTCEIDTKLNMHLRSTDGRNICPSAALRFTANTIERLDLCMCNTINRGAAIGSAVVGRGRHKYCMHFVWKRK